MKYTSLIWTLRMIALSVVTIATNSTIHSQNIEDPKNNANSESTTRARIDPNSLGMNFTIQLRTYPGRQISVPVNLVYSSKVWDLEFIQSEWDPSRSWNISDIRPNYKSGWSIPAQAPRFEKSERSYNSSGSPVDILNTDLWSMYDSYWKVARITLYMPDGSTHELTKDFSATEFQWGSGSNPNLWTGDFYSADGTGLRYNFGDKSLYMPDGSRYTHATNATTFNKFIDKHGNTIDYGSSSLTDTLGRSINYPIGTVPISAQNVNYSIPGYSTGDLDYVFKWKELDDALTTGASLKYPGSCNGWGSSLSPALFDGDWQSGQVCNSGSLFNPIVLNEIVLPDSTSYVFTYNIYGEIDKIVYPTGAYERFAYATVAGNDWTAWPYDQGNRGVTDHWISDTGSSGDEVHWEYDGTVGTRTITAPDGTTSESTYQTTTAYPGYGFSDTAAGRLLTEKSKDSNGNTISRTLNEYQYQTTNGITHDARKKRTISILFEPGNSNAIASMEEMVFATPGSGGSPSDRSYFAHLNAIQVKTYDFVSVSASTASTASLATATGWFSGSNPAVVKEMDYLYDSNYKARNINNLVTETRVEDHNGNVKAKTQISYDQSGYSLSSSGTMPSPASASWTDPLTELGSTIGAKRAQPTSVKSYYDISNGYYVETFNFFDQFGNVRKTRDGRGFDSETQYDDDYAFGLPTKILTPIPDSSGTYGLNDELETTNQYDYNSGLQTKTIDPNGLETRMEYVDDLLRPTKIYNHDGSSAVGGATETSYGAGTSASTRWIKIKSQIDSTNWKEAYTYYDGLVRTIRTRSVDDAGDNFVLTCYDNMGRVSKVTNPFKSYSTQTCATTSGLEWTTNTFDVAGRPWKIVTPDGAEVVTTYGLASTSGYLLGSVVTVEDQADKQKRTIANALGQLVRVDEPTTSGTALGTLTSPNQHTSYGYDYLSNLTTATQGSQTRTFTYDALSRLKSAANPESGTTNYTYDANSNLSTKTDARSISRSYTYDRLNRVTLRDYSDSTPDVTYYYDNLTNGKGKLKKVISSVSTTEYTSYDILGRVVSHKQTIGGNDYTTGYTYNFASQLIEETYPSGRMVKNTFATDGDLSQVETKPSGGSYSARASTFTYTAFGAISGLQLGNGKYETIAFNSRLQPIQIGLGSSTSDTSLLKIEYGYGTTANNGTVMSQKITVPGVSYAFEQAYTYDSLNRIASATETYNNSQLWTQVFGYDRYGNRNINSGTGATSLTFDASNNRISTSGYTYDSNGNTTADPSGKSFVYNGENKQTSVSNGGTLGTYYYDGDGKRVKKDTSTPDDVIFIYDAFEKLIEERDLSGTLQTSYVYAGSRLLSTETSGPVTNYLTTDHLGSPRINTDGSGNVSARHDYLPFGEEITSTLTAQRSSYGSDSIRQKFTGYERDGESGLDFAQARYFVSLLGRFTTTDPLLDSGRIEEPQTWNRYAYVLNNPLNHVDTTGLYECKGTKDQCSQFESRLSEAKDNLQKIKDPDQYKKVNNSLMAYGSKNDKNGVFIAFNNKEGNGEAVNASFKNGKLTGITVTFDKTALDKTVAAGLVGHAGNHVSYFQTIGNNTKDKYNFEFRGHEVQSLLSQARNPDGNTFMTAKDGTKYDVWNSGWKEADRETERTNAIKAWLAVPEKNGGYNLTPAVPKPKPSPKPTQRRKRG